MTWHGEVGQDKFAYDICGSHGIFLDFGCERPMVGNNTYALEAMGWRGILVDREPEMVELCRQQRKSLVVQGSAQDIDWKETCEKAGLGLVIDYLSVDIDAEDRINTEDSRGCALAVLCRMISSGFSFRVITLEHNFYGWGEEVRGPQRNFLLSEGYVLARPAVCNSTGLDFEDWWIGPNERWPV